MPKTTDAVNLDLEDLLSSKGYDVTSLDSSGKQLPTANGADILSFHFHRGGKDYGSVTISIDGLKNMIVYYDDEIANSGVNEDDMDADRGMNGTSWISLVKQLKKFAQRHQLGFVLKDTDRLRIDMKRRKQTEKELKESYDGIGFSVRSDILWPSTLFESTNPLESSEFSQWIDNTRKQQPLPQPGNKCILAMCVRISNEVAIYYGTAIFIGETDTHYILDNGRNGEGLYSKKNQLIFKSSKAFEEFKMLTTLKFSEADCPVNFDEMPVMEAFDSGKQRMTLNKMIEGAELKKIKREYNQAAKNAGGDFDGAGKKIDNMKKGLRQRDIGKDKSVTEVSTDTLKSYKRASAGDAINRQNIADRTRNKDPKIAKRNAGQELAQKKLDKKTQIDELDKSTLQSYARKALDDENYSKRPNRPADIVRSLRKIHSKDMKHNQQTKPKLDELDKKTLARYAKAAPKSADEIRKRASDFSQMGWGARDEGNTEEQDKWWSKAGSLVSKADRRTRGHDRAIDRLTKESKKLDEGYYGNRKMSYSDDTPTVKMVIKHNRQLEETDQRFRHIEKIFLETSDGERFAVPTTKPSRARMFARHIAEGGAYKDERWNHITEISEDIDNLGGFIRATRSSDKFTESAQRMIGEAVDKYNELRGTAKRLQTGRGYNSYFESYEPPVENDNDDDLLEVFTNSSVDSRIEKALPTLNKLGIRRGKLEEADMFERWADDLIDESLDIGGDRQSEAIIELFADELPVGPNAEVVIGELSDVIEDDELYSRLRKTAAVDSNSDARPQIIAWMQEQDSPKYRGLLAKLETEDEDSPEDQEKVKNADKSDSIEPAKAKPKKKPAAPGAPDAGGLPPLPPLPPLKEGGDTLASIKRLLGM